MKKIKKIRRKTLFILLLILLVIPVGITFSKYVKNFVNYYVMKSNNFYFNSDKLGDDNINYEINNWSGMSVFTIQFQLNNHKNNILTSDSDITYDVDYTCSGNVTCSLSSDNGIIYKAEKTDDLTLTVNPLRVFNTGEKVNVTITASATSPYKKTLSASFVITVGKQGISYEISDNSGQAYFDFIITNALEEYSVREAFGSYSVNDTLSIDTYKSLSDTNKSKCASSIVTLSFDPSIVVLDVTSSIFDIATTSTTNIDGVDYISSLTFKVDAVSSNQVRFYKKNVSNNYTYPYVTSTPIITFSAN